MKQEICDRMEKWIDDHFDQLIADVCRMVRIPSVSDYADGSGYPFGRACKNALDAMLAMAKEYGFDTENYSDRCGSATLRPGSSPENEIGFWGHIDVVPPGEDWTLTGPYDPIVRDGYLIGRGADDNKGPAVGVMYIMRAFKELNIPTRHGLRLFFGCDEEHGMKDVEFFTANYPARKLNIIADCGFPVCYGEKGILSGNIVSKEPMDAVTELKGGIAGNIVPDAAVLKLKGSAPEFGEVIDGQTLIRAQGLAGHTAFPEGSINAIHEGMAAALESGLLSENDRKVIEFMKRVNDDFYGTALHVDGSDEISGRTTCVGSMAHLDGEGHAVLHVNIRHCLAAETDALAECAKAVCGENGCDFEVISSSAPNYFPRENPVVDAMTDVFNELTGLDREPYVMGGGTYARKLKNALAFGMGGLPREETDLFEKGHGNCHQADEGLHLANYKRALLIFAMAVLEADRVLE